jgi:5-methylcytosine-specific restriction endonuclease McrA
VSLTTVVDHIIPHRQDLTLFWDPNNRQPSCDRHHNVVKQALEQLYAKGQATTDDLKLDSELAKTLTKQLIGW